MAKRKTSGVNDLLAVSFNPATQAQSEAAYDFREGRNLLLTGYTGTGKTFLAIALGLELMQEGEIDQIVVFRSAVPSRDIGFMPGDETEKMSAYEEAIKEAVNTVARRGDAYEIMKQKGRIKFLSTSFQRGMNYRNTLVIIDEVQNCTDNEINTVVTRLSHNSRIILCGDFRQTDARGHESGFKGMVATIQKLPQHFSVIDFGINDIIRSGLVRDWIIATEELYGIRID